RQPQPMPDVTQDVPQVEGDLPDRAQAVGADDKTLKVAPPEPDSLPQAKPAKGEAKKAADAKTGDAKKGDAKKAEPKKAEPKKAEPKKAEADKPAPKKAAKADTAEQAK